MAVDLQNNMKILETSLYPYGQALTFAIRLDQ